MDLYDKDYMMDVKHGAVITEAKVTEDEVRLAIEKILDDRKSYNTSLNYAVNYCKAALGMTGHELAVQCLYILNNLSSWRHPDAKDVRATLKAFAKS